MWQQPNRAPLGCRSPDRCVHLEEVEGADNDHHDRCQKRVPMHDDCAWHTKWEKISFMANSLPRA